MVQLEFDLALRDLIAGLSNDRTEIRRQLWILRMLMSRGDFDLAEKRTMELRTILDAHFAREESRVRDLMTVSPSFSSSDNDSTTPLHREQFIESLIQKHKAMSDSFKEMQRLTIFSTDVERLSYFDKFERTLFDCLSQEDSVVFPFLLDRDKEHGQRIANEGKKAQDFVVVA